MAEKYFRKIIRVPASCSPNVRYAEAQIAIGQEPTDEIIIPGVMPWSEYQRRLALWDEIRITVGIYANWYEGQELLLYPPQWLDRAERLAEELRISGRARVAKAVGVDPGEGGDQTAMSVVDELGLIELISKKTPDTSVITSEALAFMIKHNVPASRVVFDRGGGGKEHADRLRAQGYPVRTVAFGESLLLDPKRGLRRVEEKMDNREEKYQYRTRRSEMAGELSLLLDPSRVDEHSNGVGFAIPGKYTVLRQEMSPIPKTYDSEGRLELLPKNRRTIDTLGGRETGLHKPTLTQLIGHSPDQYDSLCLAVYGMLHKVQRAVAGGVVR